MNVVRTIAMSSCVRRLYRVKQLCSSRSFQTSPSLNSPEAPSFSSHRHNASDMRLLETRLGFGKVINSFLPTYSLYVPWPSIDINSIIFACSFLKASLKILNVTGSQCFTEWRTQQWISKELWCWPEVMDGGSFGSCFFGHKVSIIHSK